MEPSRSTTYGINQSVATVTTRYPEAGRPDGDSLRFRPRDPDVVDASRLDEFPDYMRFDKVERVFVLSEARSTGFDNVIDVQTDTVRMTHLPEDLIFE